MTNFHHQIYIPNLSVFTTEKCNLQCLHCMRGDCTNKVILDEVIEKVINSVDIIGNLYICGGEPTLAVNQLEKLINGIIDYQKKVYQFSITINGTNYSEELLRLCKEMSQYISSYEVDNKDNNKMIDISYDAFHKQEMIRLDLKNQYIENVRRYQESGFLGYIRELDLKSLKLFRCGRAIHLDKRLTVPLKPMKYYISYGEQLVAIGPFISVNVDGIVTECDASFDDQRTIYHYGNILEDDIQDICLKNGAKVVSLKKWNKYCNKELKRYSHYNH